jgi:hypothetical protein
VLLLNGVNPNIRDNVIIIINIIIIIIITTHFGTSDISINLYPSFFQLDLDNIFKWTQLWETPLNFEKCFSMHICRPGSHIAPTYTINNIPIQSCKTIKNLGITISYDLSWSHHVQKLASESMFHVHQLHRALRSPSPSTISKLYTSIIRPKLEYANIIWPLTQE